VRLGEYLRHDTDRIKPSDLPETRFRVLGVSNTEGVFLNETKLGAEINQAYYRVKPNEFCYNPYRVNVGSIGLCEFDYDNQIISGAYEVFGTDETELLPHYLLALFKSPQFLEYVNEKAHGGVRMNFKFEYLEEWEIPLPNTPEQERLCKMLSKPLKTRSLAMQLASVYPLPFPEILNQELRPLREAVIETRNGWSPPCNGGEVPVLTLSCLKNGRIDLTERKFTSETRKDISSFYVREGDFFYSRGNTPELVALAGIVGPVKEDIVFPDLLTRVVFDTSKILPEFAAILFNSELGRQYFGNVPQGASPSMVKVSQKYMEEFCVPYIGNIDKQREIISSDRATLEALSSIEKLMKDAEGQIFRITDAIWR
jgi:restriction endonuclease S subunit